MNILYIVFVNEKPVWKKKMQENSSKNTSVEKNEQYAEILRHWKAVTEGALLQKMLFKILQISQETTYLGGV